MEAAMGKRKRSPRRNDLVGRAVRVGRRALKEAESRLPADLRKQLDRRLKDADKTARAAIKQLQAQVKRASTRADVNSVLKRIDGLTRQARQIAQGATARPAPARRRPAKTASRAAPKTRKAATGAKRPAAATRKRPPAGTKKRTAPRRARATAAVVATPVMEEIDVVEVVEG
jgi:hypothetical protein